MVKLLLLALILTACQGPSQEDTASEEITITEEVTSEATEEKTLEERAEENKDKDPADILNSSDPAYYIEGELLGEEDFIKTDKGIFYLEGLDQGKPGDRIAIWGLLEEPSLSYGEEEVPTMACEKTEVLEDFTGFFLGPGDYTIGGELEPGRYRMEADDNASIGIYSQDTAIVEEDFGPDGIDSLTMNLLQGLALKITGSANIKFTPAGEEAMSNKLTTGYWQVGKHIEAGSYNFKSIEDMPGHMLVMSANGSNKLDQDIGEGASGEIFLEENDVIIISRTKGVDFEPIEG